MQVRAGLDSIAETRRIPRLGSHRPRESFSRARIFEQRRALSTERARLEGPVSRSAPALRIALHRAFAALSRARVTRGVREVDAFEGSCPRTMFAAEVGRRRLARDVHRRGKPERRIDGLAEEGETSTTNGRRARIAAAKSRDRSHPPCALTERRTRHARHREVSRIGNRGAFFNRAGGRGRENRTFHRGSNRKARSRPRTFPSRASTRELRCLRPMKDVLDRARRATGHAGSTKSGDLGRFEASTPRPNHWRGGASLERRRGVRGSGLAVARRGENPRAHDGGSHATTVIRTVPARSARRTVNASITRDSARFARRCIGRAACLERRACSSGSQHRRWVPVSTVCV